MPKRLRTPDYHRMVFTKLVRNKSESESSYAGRLADEEDFPKKIYCDTRPVSPKNPRWSSLDPWAHYMDDSGNPKPFPREDKGQHCKAVAKWALQEPLPPPAPLFVVPDTMARCPHGHTFTPCVECPTILERRRRLRLSSRYNQPPNGSQVILGNGEQNYIPGINHIHPQSYYYQGNNPQGYYGQGHYPGGNDPQGYYGQGYFHNGHFYRQAHQLPYRDLPYRHILFRHPQFDPQRYNLKPHDREPYRPKHIQSYHPHYRQSLCRHQVFGMPDRNDSSASHHPWGAPYENNLIDPNMQSNKELEEHHHTVNTMNLDTMPFPNYNTEVDRAYAYHGQQSTNDWAPKDPLSLYNNSYPGQLDESSYGVNGYEQNLHQPMIGDGVVPAPDQTALGTQQYLGYDYSADGSTEVGTFNDLIDLTLRSSASAPSAIAPADDLPDVVHLPVYPSPGGSQDVPTGVAYVQQASPVGEANGNNDNDDYHKWLKPTSPTQDLETIDPQLVQNSSPTSDGPIRIVVVGRRRSASAAIRSDHKVHSDINATPPRSAPVARAAQTAQATQAAKRPSVKRTGNSARGPQVKKGSRKRRHDSDDDDDYVPGLSGNEKSAPPKRRRKPSKPHS
ncbi:hypothetical protein F4818DRAFT_457368 [Hypoxylon cercidicola]|nr:hypothetical protein F4818DRAFT_457368 [Hypoxylon cercidicola]